MATEKETIILDLKVDQGSAITELEKTKKSIIGVKEEQQQLTKAYKQGEVTLEEYASESVRLEAILKKSQSEYNNIQKSVTGVKTQMDKLIDTNKKISSEFQNAAANIRVAGVSVGDITTKLASFANPATAAVGIVTALGAAYARSSIGAKDLEFASNQLSFATTILTDKFAGLFSSVEDGQGVFSKLVDAFVSRVGGLETSVLSKLAANAKEELEQIERDRILIQSEINDKAAENFELLTDIANTDVSINDKLKIRQQIEDNIRDIANAKLELLDRQESQEKIIGAATANKEGLERKLNELAVQRSQVLKEETKGLEKIDKQLNSILNTEQKRREEVAKAIQLQNEAEKRRRETADLQSFDPEFKSETENPIFEQAVEFRTAEEIKRDEALKTAMELEANEKAQTEVFLEQQEIRFAAASAATQALSTLAATTFGQNSEIAKATGIVEGIVNTYTGATLALRSAPPPLSFALAALTIANGLASVNQITRAAGGGDFVTKGPALMLVGDNPGGRERVTVEPLSGRGQTRVNGNRIAMAGGGTLTTGIDDGGIVRNGAVSQMQQALLFTNAIKNLPRPVVGVKQFADVANQVEVLQSVTTA